MVYNTMMINLQGKYRQRAAIGALDDVYISYGPYGYLVSEAYYVAWGYRPEIASLPWKEDYLPEHA